MILPIFTLFKEMQYVTNLSIKATAQLLTAMTCIRPFAFQVEYKSHFARRDSMMNIYIFQIIIYIPLKHYDSAVTQLLLTPSSHSRLTALRRNAVK